MKAMMRLLPREREEGATEHGDEGSATEDVEEEQQKRVQIFRATISLRDNWLHRGDALQDMDLHTYAEYVYHIEKLAAGARPDQDRGEPLFAFDAFAPPRLDRSSARGARRSLARLLR